MGVGALLGGVAAGVTGVLATNRTNESNQDISARSNEFNERMLEMQMAYNDKVTDPAYIRARLQNAGYNPNVMVGSESVGSSQSITPPRASQLPADYSGIGNAVSSAVQLATQYQAMQSQKDYADAMTNQVQIENQYRAAREISKLTKLQEEAGNERAKRFINESLSRWQDRLNMADFQNVMANTQKIREQISGICLDNAQKSVYLQSYPEIVRLQVGNAAADLNIKCLTGQLTEKQIEHEVERIAETISRTFLNDAQARQTDAQTALTENQVHTETIRQSGMQLDNTSKMQRNEFTARTFEYNVRKALYDMIDAGNNSGPQGLMGIPNLLHGAENTIRRHMGLD